jgi:hypothetical protein
MALLQVFEQVLQALRPMLSPLVSTAFFSASGLSARKLLGLVASTHCCTAKRMRALVLASPCTWSAICISVRAFSRYICAVMAAKGFAAHSPPAKRRSGEGLTRA